MVVDCLLIGMVFLSPRPKNIKSGVVHLPCGGMEGEPYSLSLFGRGGGGGGNIGLTSVSLPSTFPFPQAGERIDTLL